MQRPDGETEHRYMTLAPGEAEAIRDRVRMDADYRQAVADALAAWEGRGDEFPVYDAFIAEMGALTIKADDPAAWVVGQCTRAVRRAEMKVNAAAEFGSPEQVQP